MDGSIDPLRDIETINLELIFSDVEILERRIAKASRGAKNDKKLAKEVALLERLKAYLEKGHPAKNFELEDEDEEEWFSGYNLLTAKPVIYAAKGPGVRGGRAVGGVCDLRPDRAGDCGVR